MNERVMQFRIGMFVIVAGLVLTMLIVWFGESPTLFRDYGYLTVHYEEAPGIAVGIPVRKSGIRIGEVASIKFDDRPGKGDGVLVTLALERQYPLSTGAVPRLGRALIGDTSIDVLPGVGASLIVLSENPPRSFANDRIIEGAVAPDPANALAAATRAFERAGTTLDTIEKAAVGIAKLSESADGLSGFIDTWDSTGKKLGGLSDDLQAVVAENRQEFAPAIRSLRSAAERVDSTLDEPTRANLQAAVKQLNTGTARLDQMLTDLQPLATDLGKPSNVPQKTQLGQAIARLNRIAYDVGLLSAALADPSGTKLNSNGTLQRLLLQSDLYDNMNRAAVLVREILDSTRPVVRNLTSFSERVARDPAVLGRGILDR